MTTCVKLAYVCYLWDAFAQRQQAVDLFVDLELAFETMWWCGIIRDFHRSRHWGGLPVFVSEYHRDLWSLVGIGTTLSDEFYHDKCIPTGGVLSVECFELKIYKLPSGIALLLWVLPWHHSETFTPGSNCCTRMGNKKWFLFPAQKYKVIHFTAPRSKVLRPPPPQHEDWKHTPLPVEESSKFLGLCWDSLLSSKKHISVLKTQCKAEPQARARSLEVGRGQRHTSDAVPGHCLLQAGLWLHCVWQSIKSDQIDIIHSSGLRLALRVFCTCPVSSLCTEAHFEERCLNLSMHYHPKPVPASTIQHIMPCKNLMESLEINLSRGQIGKGAWRDLCPFPLVSRGRQPWSL